MVFTNREYLLVSLGLTSSQARVYMALVRNGPSKVSSISQSSGIHRAHLYEILRSLEKAGFVERTLGDGGFSAAPIKESALVLIKHKQKEIAELENQVSAIVEEPTKPTQNSENKREILLISNKNRTLNMVQKSLESCKSNLDLMHTWRRFSQLWPYFSTTFTDAMSRKVVIRQIVEAPKDIFHARLFLNRKIFQNKSLELRFVPITGGNFALIDNNKLLLSTTSSHENLGEAPFIYSNCEGLLGLFHNYFEVSWKSSLTLSQLHSE